MAQRITMAAVARRAGVSPMTVSNVLRGKASVAPELRSRVEEAVRETGYRVNVSARTLRSGRSGVIGLLAPGTDSPFSYYGMLGGLIAQEARRHGLSLVTETPEADLLAEVAAVERARTLAYDGLIITPLAMRPEDADLLPADLPVVVLGERPAPTGTAHISLSNQEGMFAATTHLLERGCRSIALLAGDGWPETDPLARRIDGYRDALAAWDGEAGEPMLIPVAGLTAQAGREAARDSVDRGQRPDGYVGVTDSVMLGAVRGLADRGLRVPEDALAIGFDGIPEGEFSLPSLSTISPDHRWIARRAVELLQERIDAPAPAELGGLEIRAPFTLVERESTRR